MSKGSNPTNVTTTSSSEPSEFIRPYYQQAVDAAQDLYENPNIPSFFPNNTFVDFAPETEVLSGDYLSPTTNPYSQALFNQMAGDVTSQVQSQFSKAGRLGSGANQEILSRSLGQLANQVYGDQFNRERDRQFQATQIAPQLGEMDFNDIARLQQVGQDRESLEMAKLQDAIARFDYSQQQPYIKLNQYLGALGAPVPTTTVSTQPIFRNTGAGLLGGALTGANIAGMIPGLTPGLGAIGGGLLGGFF